MEEPPSATWWTLDSLQHGHTVAETLAYADWVSDFEEEQQTRRRDLPPNVILAGDCEPRWLTRLRARFGR